MADVAQSVIDRLRAKSRRSGVSTQSTLQLFCQEEFLRRLQRSRYSRCLILKGGLLLYSLSGFSGRPTMDVDFLVTRISNAREVVEAVVREITGTDTGNDYVQFRIEGVEPVAELRAYSGMRVKLVGCIKNTRTPFHIDMGVGDIVVPKPLERAIPTQLSGFEKPVVLTYSLESTVAEKLDAIMSRMELTSRMKDFYDLYYLAGTYCFDAGTLQEAVFQTLQRRGTPIERDSLQKVRELASQEEIATRWSRFVRNTLRVEIGFEEVLDLTCAFLEPVFEAIANERELRGTWDPRRRQYVTRCETGDGR